MRYRLLMIPASVSLFVMRAGCAKQAERIDVLFGVETPGGHKKHCIRLGPHTPTTRERVRCGLFNLAICYLRSLGGATLQRALTAAGAGPVKRQQRADGRTDGRTHELIFCIWLHALRYYQYNAYILQACVYSAPFTDVSK